MFLVSPSVEAACSATITITIPQARWGMVVFDLSQATINSNAVSCPALMEYVTGQGCVPWISQYTQVYANASNPSFCADVGLSTVTVSSLVSQASNQDADWLAFSSGSAMTPFDRYIYVGSEEWKNLTHNFGGSIGDATLTFWTEDDNIFFVPVTVTSLQGTCNFAYRCTSGECFSDGGSSVDYCAQKNFIQPLECSRRTNITLWQEDYCPSSSYVTDPSTQCPTLVAGGYYSYSNPAIPCPGAIQCTSYCTNSTNPTCNSALCTPTISSACASEGNCLCPKPYYCTRGCSLNQGSSLGLGSNWGWFFLVALLANVFIMKL